MQTRQATQSPPLPPPPPPSVHSIASCILSSAAIIVVSPTSQQIVRASEAAQALVGKHKPLSGQLLSDRVKVLSSSVQSTQAIAAQSLSLVACGSNFLLSCTHHLDPAEATSFGGSGEPLDVLLLEDVTRVVDLSKRIQMAKPTRDIWSSLLRTLNSNSIHKRSRSEPASRLNPQPKFSAPANSSKFDTFIVSAEKSIVSAAGIIGLASVPQWLFSALRQYTSNPPMSNSESKANTPTSLESPASTNSTSPTTTPSNSKLNTPSLILKLNSFGRIQQSYPLTPFLGGDSQSLLNRFLMRFVYAADVQRLCAALSKAVREGKSEVYVRWDWKSLLETCPTTDSDSESESENEESDDEDGNQNMFDGDEPDISATADDASPSTPPRSSSTPLQHPSPFQFSLSAATSTDSLPLLELEQDPTWSEYQSQQPTRRQSLVEPRGMTLPLSLPSTASQSHASSSSNHSQIVSVQSASSSNPATLIWTRFLIAKSSLIPSDTPQTFSVQQYDDEEDDSLLIVVTAVPNLHTRVWPTDKDVSDSTRIQVRSIAHESGPWIDCFEEREVTTTRKRGKKDAVAGVLERVTVRVLGSLFRYAIRFQQGVLGGSSSGSVVVK